MATKRPTTRRPAAASSTTKRPAAKRTTAARPAVRHATQPLAAQSRHDATPPAPRSEPGAAARDAAGLGAAAAAIGRALGQTTAAITERLPWGSAAPDGLELLEEDHRRIEALLDDASATTARSTARRREMLRVLARELTTHERMEEKVLYPALKSHAEARSIVLEGYQEHHVADLVLKELEALPPSDERWGAKLQVLKENLEHHIEEEEGDMFKTARSLFNREQLDELGRRMRAIKEQSAAAPDGEA